MRRFPAYRLASAAFSPAGTRNTSAPALRAPNVFCFTPPIGPTAPSSAISPVATTRRPRSTSVPSSWRTSSANGSPADGPPTPPRSMSTLSGSLMSAACATRIPMIARPGSVGDSTVSHRHRLHLAVAANAEDDVVAGVDAVERRGAAAPGADRRPRAADDHVARVELGRRRCVGRDRLDEGAARRRLDVVAGLLERDGGGDLLRARHLAQPVLVPCPRTTSPAARPRPGARASRRPAAANGSSRSAQVARRTETST